MSGCGTPLVSTDITIDGAFLITIKRNVVIGHGPTIVCVSCLSDRVGAVAVTHDAWSIQQYRNCDTALTTLTPTNANPLVIPYNSGNDIVYESGYT
jgi:hypothetical protein